MEKFMSELEKLKTPDNEKVVGKLMEGVNLIADEYRRRKASEKAAKLEAEGFAKLDEHRTASGLSAKAFIEGVGKTIIDSAQPEEVKEKMDASSFNYYFEPSDDEEYALVEYEICLDGFPVKEGGITCDVTAFITGSDGQSIKLKNGSYWGATASCLDNETYYYEGIVHSEMAYRIPKEVKEYILTIGEYGENQAFVSIH